MSESDFRSREFPLTEIFPSLATLILSSGSATISTILDVLAPLKSKVNREIVVRSIGFPSDKVTDLSGT